jgi:hypothetical protein
MHSQSRPLNSQQIYEYTPSTPVTSVTTVTKGYKTPFYCCFWHRPAAVKPLLSNGSNAEAVTKGWMVGVFVDGSTGVLPMLEGSLYTLFWLLRY